jgi:hypothetical protein
VYIFVEETGEDNGQRIGVVNCMLEKAWEGTVTSIGAATTGVVVVIMWSMALSHKELIPFGSS